MEKLHIEVRAANHFVGFNSPQEYVRQILGGDYKMIKVRGKMNYWDRDILEKYISMELFHIKLRKIRGIN